MPTYHMDTPESPAPPLRSRERCDWTVTEVGPGRVSVSTTGAPCWFAVTFDRSALPQLQRVIALLEGRA